MAVSNVKMKLSILWYFLRTEQGPELPFSDVKNLKTEIKLKNKNYILVFKN